MVVVKNTCRVAEHSYVVRPERRTPDHVNPHSPCTQGLRRWRLAAAPARTPNGACVKMHQKRDKFKWLVGGRACCRSWISDGATGLVVPRGGGSACYLLPEGRGHRGAEAPCCIAHTHTQNATLCYVLPLVLRHETMAMHNIWKGHTEEACTGRHRYVCV
jgi:hypothetical protein